MVLGTWVAAEFSADISEDICLSERLNADFNSKCGNSGICFHWLKIQDITQRKTSKYFPLYI